MKYSMIHHLIGCILLLAACTRQDEGIIAKKSALGKDLERIDAMNEVLGTAQIDYAPGKSWRKAWAFYQQLPRAFAKAGYTNQGDNANFKLRILGMLVGPFRYSVFLSTDKPSPKETLMIVDEIMTSNIYDTQTLSLAHQYLIREGLGDKAAELVQKSKEKGLDISNAQVQVARLLSKMEQSRAQYQASSPAWEQQERDRKIAALKTLLN